MEETRPGEYLPIEENERGTYIMNSKDLCMISHVPELIAAGIDSFKVEGRMKHALYVATVTRAYRRAIDAVSESLDKYLHILPSLEAEIRACEGRELTTGFYFDRPGADSMSYDGGDVPESSIYLGTIERIGDDGYAEFTQKNKFLVGDTITIMKPNGDNIRAEVTAMQDEAGVSIESCPHPSRTVRILLSVRPETGDVMRMDF